MGSERTLYFPEGPSGFCLEKQVEENRSFKNKLWHEACRNDGPVEWMTGNRYIDADTGNF